MLLSTHFILLHLLHKHTIYIWYRGVLSVGQRNKGRRTDKLNSLRLIWDSPQVLQWPLASWPNSGEGLETVMWDEGINLWREMWHCEKRRDECSETVMWEGWNILRQWLEQIVIGTDRVEGKQVVMLWWEKGPVLWYWDERREECCENVMHS